MSARVDKVTASTRNRFSGVRLDRLVERRDDRAWQAEQLDNGNTRLVPLWRSRCLLQPEDGGMPTAVFVGTDELDQIDTIRPPTLLGSSGRHNYFAVTINDAQRDDLLARYPESRFSDLRLAASGMGGLEAGILAYAKALHYWQHRHTFCGVCGSPNRLLSGGHRMQCANEECNRATFPRIDPAIIVLVTHEGACLLGRQPGWPPKRYSTLAGFVEPGESLEDAVVREVFEEVQVKLKSMHYRSSQPWPFPASAMAGFYAEARNRDYRLDQEIEDVRWLTPGELRGQLEADEIRLPPPVSIAFRLLSDWYEMETGEPLEYVVNAIRRRRRRDR